MTKPHDIYLIFTGSYSDKRVVAALEDHNEAVAYTTNHILEHAEDIQSPDDRPSINAVTFYPRGTYEPDSDRAAAIAAQRAVVSDGPVVIERPGLGLIQFSKHMVVEHGGDLWIITGFTVNPDGFWYALLQGLHDASMKSSAHVISLTPAPAGSQFRGFYQDQPGKARTLTGAEVRSLAQDISQVVGAPAGTQDERVAAALPLFLAAAGVEIEPEPAPEPPGPWSPVAVLDTVLSVLGDWVEDQQSNHKALEHRDEDTCAQQFTPGDIRRMVADAAREVGEVEYAKRLEQ